MRDDRIRRIADKLLEARKSGRPIAGETPATGPASIEEVYAVQRLVAEKLGAVGAFKTGRKSPDETPIFAPVPAAVVRASPARFHSGELNLIGIELEVAFLVNKPLPRGDDPRFVERARACVSPLAAIEIIDSRLEDFETAGDLWKLADAQVNGGFVYGEPVRDWETLDLATLDVRLDVDGITVADGPANVPGTTVPGTAVPGTAVPRDAFDVFCAFARLVGDHCGGLAPGHYVTTGTLTPMRFIEPGRQVTGHVAGLGTVSVGFEAK